MKILVVYFSRGGKTRKVAEAIPQELGCEAIDLNKGNAGHLGSGYAYNW